MGAALDSAKKLLSLQYQHQGIPAALYAKLPAQEKKLLAKKGARHYLRPEVRRRLTVVLTGGVFDILHLGHAYTLEKAKSLGDFLVVVVTSDALAPKLKRMPLHKAVDRARLVAMLKAVDLVLIGGRQREKMLSRIQPDIVVFGYDQKPFVSPARCKIVQLRSHLKKKVFKSSLLAQRLEL